MSQPTKEQKSAHPNKQKLDAVVAYGAGGKQYVIPANTAGKYESKDNHDAASVEEEEVAEGRHALLLASGQIGFHSDWQFGPYIWWSDLLCYEGLHYHPNVNSYLAVDQDG